MCGSVLNEDLVGVSVSSEGQDIGVRMVIANHHGSTKQNLGDSKPHVAAALIPNVACLFC